MQDISQETHHETTRLTVAQGCAREIDLTVVGGERYFFCNQRRTIKVSRVTWQGRQYQAYPIQGTELN
ncbi:hypothetical protein ACVXG8_26740 [Escherichia coli]